jgi:hypothetical protein
MTAQQIIIKQQWQLLLAASCKIFFCLHFRAGDVMWIEAVALLHASQQRGLVASCRPPSLFLVSLALCLQGYSVRHSRSYLTGPPDQRDEQLEGQDLEGAQQTVNGADSYNNNYYHFYNAQARNPNKIKMTKGPIRRFMGTRDQPTVSTRAAPACLPDPSPQELSTLRPPASFAVSVM